MSPLTDRIGRQWRERVDRIREYEVVGDGNIFGTSLHDSYLFRSEYERARRLKARFMEEYRGASLDDIFDGSEHANGGGTCYVLETREPIGAAGRDCERARTAILSDLTLIRGIGERTQQRLKRRGYRTIADLARHPRYHREAQRLLRQIEGGETAALLEWIGRRHAKSHPLLLEASRFHDAGDFVFLDIETLGLFSRPIVLLGVARIAGAAITVSQYLLRDVREEEAALTATLAHLQRENTALVTFNGKTFDLPYFRERLAYYGIAARLAMPHFDALHFARRRWRDAIRSCRLTTLEREVFGITRVDDVPSQMVPEFYEAYLRTGNPGPLIPVVGHNRQDVVSLARLFLLLREDMNGGT